MCTNSRSEKCHRNNQRHCLAAVLSRGRRYGDDISEILWRWKRRQRHAFKWPFISKWGHIVVTMCYYTQNVNNCHWTQLNKLLLLSSQRITEWRNEWTEQNEVGYTVVPFSKTENHTETKSQLKESSVCPSELHFINSLTQQLRDHGSLLLACFLLMQGFAARGSTGLV